MTGPLYFDEKKKACWIALFLFWEPLALPLPVIRFIYHSTDNSQSSIPPWSLYCFVFLLNLHLLNPTRMEDTAL